MLVDSVGVNWKFKEGILESKGRIFRDEYLIQSIYLYEKYLHCFDLLNPFFILQTEGSKYC
jgi:hypothetical protein